jgi:hypothetical protein
VTSVSTAGSRTTTRKPAEREARPPRFGDHTQIIVDRIVTTCAAGWSAALKDQAVDMTSNALSSQFVVRSGRVVGASVVFDGVADALDEMRGTAHQFLGTLTYAVGRSMGLPPWAAETGSRVVVSVTKVVMPIDSQLQIGAAAIRVVGRFFEAEIDARECRVPGVEEAMALRRLAAELGTVFAGYADIAAVDVAHEAEAPETVRSRRVLPAEHPIEVDAPERAVRAMKVPAEHAIAVEARAIEEAIEIERQMIENLARIEGQLVAMQAMEPGLPTPDEMWADRQTGLSTANPPPDHDLNEARRSRLEAVRPHAPEASPQWPTLQEDHSPTLHRRRSNGPDLDIGL